MKITKVTSLPQKGFTLIELLVVIAVIGVLAAVVIVAIDPVEQINRGRDAGLKTAIGEMGRGMMSYGISHSNVYLKITSGAPNFITTLQSSGEIKIIPAATTSTLTAAGCVAADEISRENNYCYRTDATGSTFILYGRPQSKSLLAYCPDLTSPAQARDALYVYSSAVGRAGVVCKNDSTPLVLTDADTESDFIGQ